METRRVEVFGPAYLDRVVRVDRPLIDPALGPPLDQSADGTLMFGPGDRLMVRDPAGYSLEMDLPSDWPGPAGEIQLALPVRAGIRGDRIVRSTGWHDDLGGMGAGFASALGGRLFSALGPASDATSAAISRRLAAARIPHDPIRVADRTADWTLLITSGEFGDKLPICFRGCHAALKPDAFDPMIGPHCDLRVVASLPNSLAARLLAAPGAGIRFFAPALRNMLDRECVVSSFAHAVDVLSCNRTEWQSLEGREEVAWRVSILVVTDGARGASVRYTTPAGESEQLGIPAFRRARPPRDTNRAGESFAAALLNTLLDHHWVAQTGVIDQSVMRLAATRASAAAALELDKLDFGFPTALEIDAVIRDGLVA